METHGWAGLNLQISNNTCTISCCGRGNGKSKGENIAVTQGKTSTWASIGSGYLFAPNTINPLWWSVASLFVELTEELSSWNGPTSVPRVWPDLQPICILFPTFSPRDTETPGVFLSLSLFLFLYFHRCNPLHSAKWNQRERNQKVLLLQTFEKQGQ